jgi:8-amino-7-oxononanoate synthase
MHLGEHHTRNWFEAVPTHRQRSFLGSDTCGVHIQIGNEKLINFASNDYLGLRQHALLKNTATQSIQNHGIGSGASRLVSGDCSALHTLEHELATWKGYEACLVLGSGMLANIGLVQALADRNTSLFSDKLNHASLVDGARLSHAKTYRFPHCEYEALASLLQKHPADKRIIISDGVFSMDGDCADVAQLLSLAEKHDALLFIDDAHGIGCMGEHHKGLTHAIAGHKRLIEVGTFGKAFGGYGAFILGTYELIDALKQRLRTMIYSTALPAFIPETMLKSLHLLQEGTLQSKLNKNIQLFLALAPQSQCLPSQTPIQALIIGDDQAALHASKQLRDAGLFVPAIRPPTVPEGTARLRITLSAAHEEHHIKQLAQALQW